MIVKKKKNKILISLIIAAVLLVCMSSCKKEDPAEDIDKVGIILPSNSDNRWVECRDTFEEYFADKDIECEVLFSQDSSSAEKSSVEALIQRNSDVIIICPADPENAGAAVKTAKKAGLKVINIDRLIPGSEDIDFYINFSSYEAGKKQGQYLVDAFKDKESVPLYLYAGDPGDREMQSLFSGAWSVLRDAVALGQFRISNNSGAVEKAGSLLDREKDEEALASVMMTSFLGSDEKAVLLAASNLEAAPKEAKGDVAILSPTDSLARVVYDTFSKDPEIKSIVITGMGETPEAIEYIQEGKQSMTIRMDYKALSITAAETATKLFDEESDMTSEIAYNNGAKDIPTFQAETEVVDKALLDQQKKTEEEAANAKAEKAAAEKKQERQKEEEKAEEKNNKKTDDKKN